jgi:hypothetical protein
VGDQVRAVRALVMCAAVALGGVPGAAMAQNDGPTAQQEVSSDAGAAGRDRWGDGRVAQDPRKVPARGEPYNWRQMGFGAVIMLAMLAFVVWLIRRTKGTPRQTRKS